MSENSKLSKNICYQFQTLCAVISVRELNLLGQRKLIFALMLSAIINSTGTELDRKEMKLERIRCLQTFLNSFYCFTVALKLL